MRLKATRPPAVVADAIARLVDGRAWSGSAAELHAALGAVATDVEREAAAWPVSAVVLASGLLGLSDALRERGLRMIRMPDALLIERIPQMLPGGSPARGRHPRVAA